MCGNARVWKLTRAGCRQTAVDENCPKFRRRRDGRRAATLPVAVGTLDKPKVNHFEDFEDASFIYGVRLGGESFGKKDEGGETKIKANLQHPPPPLLQHWRKRVAGQESSGVFRAAQ